LLGARWGCRWAVAAVFESGGAVRRLSTCSTLRSLGGNWLMVQAGQGVEKLPHGLVPATK